MKAQSDEIFRKSTLKKDKPLKGTEHEIMQRLDNEEDIIA